MSKIARPDAADVVVGCAAGLSFEQMAPWIGSLDACGFQGRRVVIHLDIEAETVAELLRRGYETYDASLLHVGDDARLGKNPRHEGIAVNRFFYIWHFLSRAEACNLPRYLIATDVSDVIFQRNPSDWLERRLGDKKIVVGCESLRFEDEPWGAAALLDSYGIHVWNALRRKEIYNSGTIAGEYQVMLDLSLQIFLLSPGGRVPYSDQQALNLLLDSQVYRAITCFASSEDGWACQAGTTADPVLLKEVEPVLTGPRPSFDGRCVRTAAGVPYTLVHQYDRVPEWRTALIELHRSSMGLCSAHSHPPGEGRSSSWARFRTGRLWRTLRRIRPLRSALYLAIALKEAMREDHSASLEAIEADFSGKTDPWNYESDPKEQARFAEQARFLDQVQEGRQFAAGLEIGCAEGLFTEILAQRCESLLVLDLSRLALERTQARCRWADTTRFGAFDLRKDAIPGTFDLIVIAGVLEYFTRRSTFRTVREKLVSALRPGGYLMLETTRSSPVVEASWWARRLIRGRWINAYFSSHPALYMANEALTDTYALTMYKRRAAA